MPSEAKALRAAAGLSAREHWCESMPDALLCFDERFHVVFLNRAATQLCGGHTELVAGAAPWHWGLLVSLLEELRLDALVPKGQAEGAAQVVRRVTLGDGKKALALEVSAAVSWKGAKRLYTLVARRQNGQGPGAHESHETQRRQVIGALAGGIAHDFNNILTAVIGHIELALAEPGLSEAGRLSLEQAVDSARRGALLNTKLQTFTRLSVGGAGPINPERLIGEAVFILRRSIPPLIRIESSRPAEPPWFVRADPGQFMQVLMNLALNARDAMPKGGKITFQAVNRHFADAEVRPPRLPGDFLQITVRDTGQGMSKDVLARLFEPYFTTKEYGKGAGLGLSIANHLVVQQGGWMEVESEPGYGSQFHVLLPRVKAPVSREEHSPARLPDLGENLDGGETILVADDEETVRVVIRAMLSYHGYKMIEAGDGGEAIEKFRAAAGGIDMVLLDVQMPHVNGWDALRRIREISSQVPVLMLSGGLLEPQPKGGPAPAAEVLQKPFDSTELLRAVRRALDVVPRTV